MRVQDHLKATRLDKEQTDVQAREVAVFLCGTALIGWEADVRQAMIKNTSATIQEIINTFAFSSILFVIAVVPIMISIVNYNQPRTVA